MWQPLLAGLFCLFAAALLVWHTFKSKPLHMLAKARVLLVTAHPDDEAMFFSPLLLRLAELKARVFLLCLSTGNADGLGATRVLELKRSAALLHLAAADVLVVDDARLPDGLQQHWDGDVVAAVIQKTIQTVHATLVVSFDAVGVSGHPNHIATGRGAVRAVATAQTAASPVELLQLHSVPFWRKYLGVLNVLSLLAASSEQVIRLSTTRPTAALHAMRAHTSQWVWYRRLFVLFSAYSWLNELKQT